MSGGGGGGPSSQTVVQSNIPDWLRPQVEALIGGATQQFFNTQTDPSTGKTNITGIRPYVPYSANPADYVAPLSPLQRASMQGTANLRLPGEFDTARTAMQGAGMGAGQTAGTAAQYAAQQAGAGSQYAQQATDPTSIQAYMSPYMQNVVDVQQQRAQRDADIANQAIGANFASRGAFGGARNNIADAQAAANLARQRQEIQATGLQNAFQNAQQAQQFGANLGLQGLAGAQQGLGNVLGAYGLMNQVGTGLGALGTQRLGAQQNILGAQAQAGALQQQQQQNIINQAINNFANAQQYPTQQFNAYNALLRGYAVPGQTATQYQAPPSMINQLAGLGGAAYTGAKAFGMKRGGLVDLGIHQALQEA